MWGIEAQNAVYLPQAKIFARCCALGPALDPAWEVDLRPGSGVGGCGDRAGGLRGIGDAEPPGRDGVVGG